MKPPHMYKCNTYLLSVYNMVSLAGLSHFPNIFRMPRNLWSIYTTIYSICTCVRGHEMIQNSTSLVGLEPPRGGEELVVDYNPSWSSSQQCIHIANEYLAYIQMQRMPLKLTQHYFFRPTCLICPIIQENRKFDKLSLPSIQGQFTCGPKSRSYQQVSTWRQSFNF